MKNILNIWGGGQLMAFSGVDGKTDYENGLVLRSSFKTTALDVKIPGNAEIFFSTEKPSQLYLSGDVFSMGFEDNSVRGAFLDAFHLLIDGKCEIRNEDEKIRILSKGNKTLLGTAAFFRPELLDADISEAIEKRNSWIDKILKGRKKKGAFYKAVSQTKTQVYSPEGTIKHRWTTPDRWPHRQIWLWDSVFHAIGIRHLDASLAQDAILAVSDVQCEDGLIPLCASPYGKSAVTQPPVLALGTKLVNEMKPDKNFIKELYPKLKNYLEWDMKNRDTDSDGLLEWHIAQHVNCRSGESGMDNSPRFDAALNLGATDFNSMIALECEIMAEFAEELNFTEDIAYWQGKHKELCSLMNRYFWDTKSGFYYDWNNSSRSRTDVMASSGFLPLICGAATQEQAKILAGHIKNPETFGTELPVASIAKCCGKYYQKDMWRGPVWVNINWLIAMGFRRYGMNEISRYIIEKTTGEIEKYYDINGTLFEFFDDRREIPPPELLRKGKCAPEISPTHQAFSDYGWTASLYIDMRT